MQGGAKPAILDVDVHAGNGTQGILYERDDVFFCSVHGDPRGLYPGTPDTRMKPVAAAGRDAI